MYPCTLLPYAALLKCVVTEVVLFSILAFNTLKFHKATYLRCGEIFSDSIITHVLLLMTVNKFDNRSIFDGIKAYKTKGVSFLDHPVYACEFVIKDRGHCELLCCIWLFSAVVMKKNKKLCILSFTKCKMREKFHLCSQHSEKLLLRFRLPLWSRRHWLSVTQLLSR